MKHLSIVLMSTLLLSSVQPSRAAQAAIDHTSWSALLARYVDDQGRVAYKDLQTNDHAAFAAYLDTLARAQTDGLSEAEEKALWINAYNAVIVSGVLQGYSAESLLGRKRLFSWFTVRVAGKDRTPDEIEHQILRKKFHDPRIHFTIVCASSSCPKLRRESYTADRLEEQLNDATRAFLADPARNRIEPQGVTLSKIFSWFADDFRHEAGSVVAFVRRYVSAEKQAMVNLTDGDLRYLDYHWTLNAQDGQRVP
jgi:hypothetical protein